MGKCLGFLSCILAQVLQSGITLRFSTEVRHDSSCILGDNLRTDFGWRQTSRHTQDTRTTDNLIAMLCFTAGKRIPATDWK